MPADFEKCVATKGSKVITKSLPGDKYVKLCKLPGGKWTRGEVHTKASPGRALMSEKEK